MLMMLIVDDDNDLVDDDFSDFGKIYYYFDDFGEIYYFDCGNIDYFDYFSDLVKSIILMVVIFLFQFW